MVTTVKKCSVRLLTKTLAVVSLLASTSAHPLGIGEIQLHSALNQNLDAEISLTLSGESVSDIKVNLASPEKFDGAGVSWTYFLSKIKFETIARSNGSATIKLTSNEALKEPFLDFLLEVSWPKGNLYREFTVLVDPPSVYNQTDAPVSPGYRQPSVASLQRQSQAYAQSIEGEYGPTLGNDTLWSVAERARGQNDVSVEQMMIAIYEANPQAFYKGNVHALMAGKMLKIPETGLILKLSRNQALAEFNRHTKAWRNHSAPAHVDTAKEKPVLNKDEEPGENQLTLIAPAKTAVEGQAVVVPVDEQASPEPKKAEAPSVTPEAVKDKSGLSAAEGTEEETGEAASADIATQSKIAALEKQLAMMQELIALKDQQLATLQNQSQANPVVQQRETPSEIVVPQPADQAKPVPQPAVVQPVKPVRPVQPAAQPKHEADNSPDLYYLGVGSIGAAILTLLGWLWWRKRKVDEETNTESMFASSSMIESSAADENISVPVVEEGAVHDAGAVGESSFLSEFTPSDFDSFDTDQGEIDPISEADVYLAYGRYQQAEELIRQAIKDQPNRDECKLKLLEIFYANENKTAFEAYANELAEAGKRNEADFWEQAAEMGREICPDSALFSSGESVSGNFVKETAESRDNIVDFDLTSSEVDVDEARNNQDIDFDLSSFSMDDKESDEADKGVIASNIFLDKSSAAHAEGLGSYAIEPDEADRGVIAPNTIADKPSKSRTEDLDFDFELSSFTMESDEADKGVIASNTVSGRSSATQIEDLDFDLSSFSMESDEADKGVIASSPISDRPSETQVKDIDFELSSFSMDSKEADKDSVTTANLSDIPSETQQADKPQEFESYEFDFNDVKTKKIDDLDFNALGSSDKDIEFSEDELLDLNDDFDFNFDLEIPSTKSGQNADQYDEFGVSDLTDMDELETKLDLAKAYVDMGDADAAKDIAKEVLEQGTVEQKKIAKALLDELD